MESTISERILQDFTAGTMPEKYRDAVVAWLLSNDESKEEALRKLWDETDGTPELSDIEALSEHVSRRESYIQRQHTARLRGRLLRYAAVVMLPLLTALGVWQYSARHYSLQTEMVECHVPLGETTEITLSDGSVVTANAGTTLLYPRHFNSHTPQRSVYLLGEARFSVAKDRSHPFVVHAGELEIRVTGTQFNVKAYTDDDQIVTTLEEGSVIVTDNAMQTQLIPNEQVVYTRRDKHMTKSVVTAADYSEWTRGNLKFNQQTLDDILSEIGRKYDVDFKIEAGVDLKKKYTMNFKADESIDKVMNIIVETSQTIWYNRKDKTIVLTRATR